MSTDRKFVELLTALHPFLDADTRKSCQAIRSMLDLFPDLSLAEVAKKLAANVASAKKSVPALANRANALVNRSSEESVQSWLDDVGKLNKTDFKQLGKALNFDLSGDSAEDLESLRKWAESGGQTKPPDAKERAERIARELAGNLPDRMRVVDFQVAEEVIRKAEALATDKKLTKDEFEAFGKLLGIPVTGTKPTMLKQIKDFVNRLARTHGQTQF